MVNSSTNSCVMLGQRGLAGLKPFRPGSSKMLIEQGKRKHCGAWDQATEWCEMIWRKAEGSEKRKLSERSHFKSFTETWKQQRLVAGSGGGGGAAGGGHRYFHSVWKLWEKEKGDRGWGGHCLVWYIAEKFTFWLEGEEVPKKGRKGPCYISRNGEKKKEKG